MFIITSADSSAVVDEACSVPFPLAEAAAAAAAAAAATTAARDTFEPG